MRVNTVTTYTLLLCTDLTPFTEYTVSVAALTSQGRGPHSSNETNTTFEGCKYMQGISIVNVRWNYIMCK